MEFRIEQDTDDEQHIKKQFHVFRMKSFIFPGMGPLSCVGSEIIRYWTPRNMIMVVIEPFKGDPNKENL